MNKEIDKIHLEFNNSNKYTFYSIIKGYYEEFEIENVNELLIDKINEIIDVINREDKK